MRIFAATFFLGFALAPTAVAEDQASRSSCLQLLQLAVDEANDLLAGFKPPNLSLPAHTLRADVPALHCFFESNGKPLYLTRIKGKAYGFLLEIKSIIEIPVSQ
ncbi:MAG: hypothetical protein OXF51_01520 [Alphaproteobacteria bacterium]|nr:hypothetical protein [Alphaproteobacteria bacterium]